MTLYELTDTYAQLYEMASGGDIDEQTFQDTLEAMDFTAELEAKAEGYAKIITMLQGEIKLCEAEEKRIAQSRKAKTNNIERMKARLQAAMEATGQEKIKTPLFSLWLQNNTYSLDIEDPAAVSDEYLIAQPPKVNTAAIKQDLKDGKELPFATLRQSRSLRIK